MRLLIIIFLSIYSTQAAVVQRHTGSANCFDLKALSQTISFYSASPSSSHTILTHHRRDLVPVLGGVVVAPEGELDFFGKTHDYWSGMATKRFHYYTQQSMPSTNAPELPVPSEANSSGQAVADF